MAGHVRDILTDHEFQIVSDLVYRHCGIHLHAGKKELTCARLSRRIRQAGFANADEYLAYLRADSSGDEFGRLIDTISTNLTHFFRERAHFDFLAERYLPGLLSHKQECGSRRIRGWSAGCSSGEEAYSLAITLLESLGDRTGWDVRLLAIDISRPMLEHARRGVYESSRVEAVPPDLRGRYFTTAEDDGRTEYRANQDLRQMIRFNYLNLIESWPFDGTFDFIFCRNVMIYFDKATQQNLVTRFYQCLEGGGVLFTGHAESLTGISHRFRCVLPTVYVK